MLPGFWVAGFTVHDNKALYEDSLGDDVVEISWADRFASVVLGYCAADGKSKHG